MAEYLYKKLCDLNILGRAWHLAINDSRNDFVEDPYRYSDFAFKIEENLQSIANTLKAGEYHPHPLINIDVPKSTLSVRPGSITSIEDRIVLFAITFLIAPRLDSKLPRNVYSYRLKRGNVKRTLFKDWEILKFPFLKGKTIRRRIDIMEPWYGQWPKFIEKTIYTFEQEGYDYLTLSDISAYFENINIQILRDILLQYLPKEHKIVNLMCSILEYWSWPTIHGLSIERGIPQGNDVSSFLGNIYLLPLDCEFMKFSKIENIKYFRYMDDVKIFSKEENIAREAVFKMNNVLRRLHLNIQGTKTMILEDDDIRRELIDKRLDAVNAVIKETQKKHRQHKPITKTERDSHVTQLKHQYRTIHKKNRAIQDKDLRLYRRLITAFRLLDSSYMVNSVLKQLPRNPDARLTDKAVNYFKHFPRCSKNVSTELLQFLMSPINLFPYQEAWLIHALRYLREIPADICHYVRKRMRLSGSHWFVKMQCILLLNNMKLRSRTVNALRRMYEKEPNNEVKRALLGCLCQLNRNDLDAFLRRAAFDNCNKISSVGRMLLSLLVDHDNAASKEISRLLRRFDERFFLDSYYKIEVIKYCKQKKVRQRLLSRLIAVKRLIKREHLKQKVERAIKILQSSMTHS